ncbi:hypothetical protein Ddye_019881 [Dipteronia dyeriana]|uniref:Transposase MuDR plant domain-containing protein n=1 Tax=Dipteronia dyeriana TaxID=168575 RepID=A0AAD9WVH5_9ROSI|nr:hypothetical protein Ddye_019881 [Dipteronia dyeriana]
MYVSRNMTYEELVSIVQTVVKYDVNKYIADLQSISIVPGTTCRTFIRNDDDVLFMLGEDRVIPQENLYGVPPEVADHGDIVRAQLDDDFSCHIEMNAGQYNHQYNEMYNERNNERNNEPHNLPINEVANEPNLHPVHNVANNDVDKEPFERERRARHVHRCSSTAVHIAGTSEVWPDDLKRLAGNFTMRHNFEWKVKRSNKTTLHLVCLMENCMWKLRAIRRDEVTYFQVRSFINEHTCPLEKIHRRHRQASAVIIGEVVAPRLQQQDGRLMRPKDIIADMKIMYGIQIMYSKAHQALDYALSLTYGTHEESFQLLPSFGYVLEQQNSGTITDLHL